MNTVVVFGVGIVVLLLMVVLVYAWTIARQRRSMDAPAPANPAIADARLDPGERASSLVAEQIEEMVRRRLQAYPDLADVALDFGTVRDGTIDIWVDGDQYDDPEDIPDERIREAIKAAVEEFNAR